MTLRAINAKYYMLIGSAKSCSTPLLLLNDRLKRSAPSVLVGVSTTRESPAVDNLVVWLSLHTRCKQSYGIGDLKKH